MVIHRLLLHALCAGAVVAQAPDDELQRLQGALVPPSIVQAPPASHAALTAAWNAALVEVGRLEGRAFALLPTLRLMAECVDDREERRQMLLAIARVAPCGTGDEAVTACREGLALLHRLVRADPGLDRSTVLEASARLRWGPLPGDETLLQALRSGSSSAEERVALLHAAADALGATVAAGELRPRAQQVLRERFTAMAAGTRRLFDRTTRASCAVLARALWRAGDRSSDVAAAALTHWDEQLQLAALAALRDHPPVTALERFAVSRMLDSVNPALRRAADEAAVAFGAQAIVLLPELQWAVQSASDAELMAYTERRARLRQQVEAGRSAAFCAVLAAALAVVRGEALPAPAPGPAGLADGEEQLLADLLLGCRRRGDDMLSVARAIAAAGVRHKAVVLVLADALEVDTAAEWAVAAEALTAFGPLVAVHCPDLVERLQATAARAAVSPEWALWTEMRCAVGPAAGIADLQRALDSPRWFVVLHAMLELVRRRAPLDAPTASAVLQAAERDYAPVPHRSRLGPGPWPPSRRALRAAAALVLFAGGDERWRGADLLRALGDELQIAPAELAAVLQVRRATGKLDELVDAIIHRNPMPR